MPFSSHLRVTLCVTSLSFLLHSVSGQLKPCPPQPGSTGNSTCLASETCCVEQYFGAPGCLVPLPSGGTTCCAPGPPLPLSSTLPNCLVIGDSVSDQYTPSVAVLLNKTCFVQHAPWWVPSSFLHSFFYPCLPCFVFDLVWIMSELSNSCK